LPDQAATLLRRRRAATPTMPKPAISISQLAGSGTALSTRMLSMIGPAEPFGPAPPKVSSSEPALVGMNDSA
jgi:hypothetical protein